MKKINILYIYQYTKTGNITKHKLFGIPVFVIETTPKNKTKYKLFGMSVFVVKKTKKNKIKYKLFGIPVFVVKKTKKNKIKYKLFGIPVFIIKISPKNKKKYLLGLRIYKRKITENETHINFNSTQIDPNKLKVGFKLPGGMGDVLININYIYYLINAINEKNISIDIYAHKNVQLAKSLLPKDTSINYIAPEDTIPDDGNNMYDLFIVLMRIPNIKRANMQRIRKFSPILFDYVQLCEKWKYENMTLFNDHAISDNHINRMTEIIGQKRIQQADIYDFFNVSEEFIYKLDLDKHSINNLENLQLKDKKFITIHRGYDAANHDNPEHNKLWPVDFYSNLIKLLKQEYPDIKIVQLGVNEHRCPEFDNVDLSLVGKTTMEDIKVLLSKSLLHIDSEGGYVHLRHALKGGKSVVLFGPTSPKLYGYNENINLKGNGCIQECEWIIRDWHVYCVRGFEKVPCMYSITPEFVFNEIKKELNN